MRPVGRGSVVQRDMDRPRSRCRDWELSVKMDDGRRRTRAFHGTWTQATEALSAFVAELEDAPAEGMTLGGYIRLWTDRRERSGAYAARTLRTDREKLAPVLALLGDRPISSVTRDDVRKLYEDVMGGKTPSGRKWSAHSVNRMRTALSKVYADAIKDGYATSSPVAGVDHPAPPRSPGSAMPPAEMDAVLAALDYSQPAHRAVALALGCGLRRSEACALLWSDVREGCVHVTKSAEEDGGDKSAKTASGNRTVPMPPDVAREMERHRSCGKVCGMLPHSLSVWWAKHRDALGCSGYRFHDLRHSYATRLAASGVHMRVAMELCGWSSVDTAMKVYTHVSHDMQREAVRAAFG